MYKLKTKQFSRPLEQYLLQVRVLIQRPGSLRRILRKVFHHFIGSSFQMLRSFGIATSFTTTVFWCLSTTTASGWLVITSSSVWIWKSYKIVAGLFSTTFGSFRHLDCGDTPYLLQMFQCTIPATWSCRSLWSFSAFSSHFSVFPMSDTYLISAVQATCLLLIFFNLI